MKIAVTGATGFIGRHLVAELDRRSLPAVLVCRSADRVPSTRGHHRVVIRDIGDPARDAFEALGRPDTLIHLAWGGLPNYNSLHHFEAELPIQYAFVKQLVESGLRNCFVTGTCFEYGHQSGQLREDTVTSPGNPYGFAKDTLRRQLEFLQRSTPFNLTWARLFYLYGEGQASGSLLPQISKAVAQGSAEFAMSGGEQLRDYLPVDVVAAHLVSLALAGGDNGVVNICSGAPISVRALVEGWISEHDWAITPVFGRFPYPKHEPMEFWGDASKLNRLLQREGF